eukprot:COSAG05_NODE_17130_length_331_cov_0.887931_1_plen_64_part_01
MTELPPVIRAPAVQLTRHSNARRMRITKGDDSHSGWCSWLHTGPPTEGCETRDVHAPRPAEDDL